MSGAVSVFGIPARTAQRSGTQAWLLVPAAAFSAGHPGSLGCPPGSGSPRFPSAGLRSERLCLLLCPLLLLCKPASLQPLTPLLRELHLRPGGLRAQPHQLQHLASVRSGKLTLTSLMHPFQWCNGESLDRWVSGDRAGPGPEPSFPVSGTAQKASWCPAGLCTVRS